MLIGFASANQCHLRFLLADKVGNGDVCVCGYGDRYCLGATAAQDCGLFSMRSDEKPKCQMSPVSLG